ANLDILCGERLWENAARVGPYLVGRLREITDPRIGEIRGIGLLIGIELVAGPDKTPLAESQVVAIQKRIRERGIIVGRNADTVTGHGNVLTVSPPLILTEEQAGEIASVLAESLAATSANA